MKKIFMWLADRLVARLQLPLTPDGVDNGSSLSETQAKLDETRRVGADVAEVAYQARAIRRQNNFGFRIAQATRRTHDDPSFGS